MHTSFAGNDDDKPTLSFLGQMIGRACLCEILAIGINRLRKCIKLAPDLRVGKDKGGSRETTRSVDAFLSSLYSTVAETLPDKLLGYICKLVSINWANAWMTKVSVKSEWPISSFKHVPFLRFLRRGRAATADDPDFDVDSDFCDVEDMRDWLDAPGKGPMWDIIQPGDKKITKWLPPGTVSDLFEHYSASRQLFGAECVSYLNLDPSFSLKIFEDYVFSFALHMGVRYGTFLHVYKSRWADILKFRAHTSYPGWC